MHGRMDRLRWRGLSLIDLSKPGVHKPLPSSYPWDQREDHMPASKEQLERGTPPKHSVLLARIQPFDFHYDTIGKQLKPEITPEWFESVDIFWLQSHWHFSTTRPHKVNVTLVTPLALATLSSQPWCRTWSNVWDVSGVTGCVSLLVFLRVPLPAPSRSQALVDLDDMIWCARWRRPPKWWPRRSSCLNPVSREFSVSQTSGIKAKLPAPTTRSAFSRSVMSNSEIVEKIPLPPQQNCTLPISAFYKSTTFLGVDGLWVQIQCSSRKWWGIWQTDLLLSKCIYIYIHTFLYRRHYRFYPPDLFVCGLNPHMFFQSGVHHIDTLYMFDDMFYTDTLYIRTTLRIMLLFLNYHLLW